MKVIVPKAPKTPYRGSTPTPAAAVTVQPSAPQQRHGRRPPPGAGQPIAEQERLDRARDQTPGQRCDAAGRVAIAGRRGLRAEEAGAHGQPCQQLPAWRGSVAEHMLLGSSSGEGGESPSPRS
jgi:hypothetical protein